MSNWLLKTTCEEGRASQGKIGGAVGGGKYFVYTGNDNNAAYNRQIFQEKMGMLKAMIDFDFIQEEMGGKDKSKVIDKRKIEFKKLCDNLTDYFLKWLHDMQWNSWPQGDDNFGVNRNILSCLDLDWCIDELKPIIELINILNKEVLDNKYSGKFGSMSLKNHIENLTNEVKHKFKPTKF